MGSRGESSERKHKKHKHSHHKKRRHSDSGSALDAHEKSHKSKRHRNKHDRSRSPSVDSKTDRQSSLCETAHEPAPDALEQLRQLAKAYNAKPSSNEKKASSAEPPLPTTGKRRVPMTPQTKESFEKERSVIRRELDPETGRIRLIKGSGEIMETIVTRDQHRQINKTATMGDGIAFQARLRDLL